MPSKNAIIRIHIAKKDLALSDATYRDMLGFNFGVKSAKELTEPQAMDLLELFKAKGWQPAPFNPGQQRQKTGGQFIEIKPGPAAKQQRKVLALWHELGYGMAKLHTRVKNQFGVERFEWLTDPEALHILITDLAKRVATAKRGA